MMVNGATIVGGRVSINSSLSVPTSWNQGLPYLGQSLAVNTLNGAPSSYNAGLGFIGQHLSVHILEVNPPVHDDNAGWPVDRLTGALFMNLTLPVAGYVNGWPVAANGTICATTAVPTGTAFSAGFDNGFH